MQTGVNFTGLELSLELYSNSAEKLYSVAGSVCHVAETIQQVQGIEGVQQLSKAMQETSRLIQLVGEEVQWRACNWVSALGGWVSALGGWVSLVGWVSDEGGREKVNINYSTPADLHSSLSLDGTVACINQMADIPAKS